MKKKIIAGSLLLGVYYLHGMQCDQFRKKGLPNNFIRFLINTCNVYNTYQSLNELRKGLQNAEKQLKKIQENQAEVRRNLAYQEFINGKK